MEKVTGEESWEQLDSLLILVCCFTQVVLGLTKKKRVVAHAVLLQELTNFVLVQLFIVHVGGPCGVEIVLGVLNFICDFTEEVMYVCVYVLCSSFA